jgi:hypothetical protein
MANYYTEASFVVPLNQEQTKFAFDVLDCVQDGDIDFNSKRKSVAAKSFKSDVYKTAKKLALSLDDYEPGDVYLDFQVEPDSDGIWFSHEESINTDTAANFILLILKYFNLDICVGITAAHTCSKARLDAFGGHAIFITKKGMKWISTFDWLHDQTIAFNKRLAARA